MSEEIKTQAQAIARMAEAGTSYVVGSWWTDGCCAIKLPGGLGHDMVLELKCRCGQSGCGCDCDACSDCLAGTSSCVSLRSCPTLEPSWGGEGMYRLNQIALLLPTLLSASGTGQPVTLKRRGPGKPRCLIAADGAHALAADYSRREYVAHAALRYLSAGARQVRPTTWNLSAVQVPMPDGKEADGSILLGYRSDELVMVLAPMSTGQTCEAACWPPPTPCIAGSGAASSSAWIRR